ncbi:MAG TPA: hypothetical protein VL400_10810, partial [Polyangiaceae bacterium]|nr:hypothetical protein [Polyangiaceae bacterium]
VTADTVSFDTGLDAPITLSKLRAIDYDGDGNVDVLAVVAYSGPKGSGAKAWLLRNAGGGALDAPAELVPPKGTTVVDARAIEPAFCPEGADGSASCDSTRSLVVASDAQVVVCSRAAEGAPLTSIDCDQSFTTQSDDLILGTVVDDFDGDGLVDVAVLRTLGTEVYRQCAASEVFSGNCSERAKTGTGTK